MPNSMNVGLNSLANFALVLDEPKVNQQHAGAANISAAATTAASAVVDEDPAPLAMERLRDGAEAMMFLGRLPADTPAANIAWADEARRHDVGLIVEMARVGRGAIPSLPFREPVNKVKNAEGQVVEASRVRTDPVRRGETMTASCEHRPMEIRTQSVAHGEDPEQVSKQPAHSLEHVLMNGLNDGVMSAEDTLDAVEFIARFRLTQPGRQVMMLAQGNAEGATQLVLARQLYDLHRDGRLTRLSLPDELDELYEKLSRQLGKPTPEGESTRNSLRSFGELLCQRPISSLVAAPTGPSAPTEPSAAAQPAGAQAEAQPERQAPPDAGRPRRVAEGIYLQKNRTTKTFVKDGLTAIQKGGSTLLTSREAPRHGEIPEIDIESLRRGNGPRRPAPPRGEFVELDVEALVRNARPPRKLNKP